MDTLSTLATIPFSLSPAPHRSNPSARHHHRSVSRIDHIPSSQRNTGYYNMSPSLFLIFFFALWFFLLISNKSELSSLSRDLFPRIEQLGQPTEDGKVVCLGFAIFSVFGMGIRSRCNRKKEDRHRRHQLWTPTTITSDHPGERDSLLPPKFPGDPRTTTYPYTLFPLPNYLISYTTILSLSLATFTLAGFAPEHTLFMERRVRWGAVFLVFFKIYFPRLFLALSLCVFLFLDIPTFVVLGGILIFTTFFYPQLSSFLLSFWFFFASTPLTV